MPRNVVLVLLSAVFCACGGIEAGASSDADVADPAQGDTLGDASAGFACGKETCVSGQVCTQSYGVPGDAGPDAGSCAACDPGGTCPSGQACVGIGACCRSVFYSCVKTPKSCTGEISCSSQCGRDVCIGGWCDRVSDGVVTCGRGG